MAYFATLPRMRDVNGPDDFIAIAGDNAMVALLEAAEPLGPGKGNGTQVPGVLASEVKAEKVGWLWQDRLPLGKVTVWDGDPGVAKSTCSLDLAARLTNGWTMPDESECGCPASGVVVVSLEDGKGDTIKPRLAAAGADLTKVRIIDVIVGPDGIERTPTIPTDLPAIEAAIKDRNAALLIIDPIVATLSTSDTNTYKDQDVRRALAPLVALAERTGVAVIVIRHLNKTGGTNPKYRGGGTIAFTGLARAEFLFAEDPDEEGAFVMAWVKGNLAPKTVSLKYKLIVGETGLEEVAEALAVTWLGESKQTARSLLAEPENEEESNALRQAKSFLLQLLESGPVKSDEVKRQSRSAGVSFRTLERAKAQMRVKAVRVGGYGQRWLLAMGIAGD
jgi:hypothetical protein